MDVRNPASAIFSNYDWLLLDDDREECIAPRVMDPQRLFLIFVFLFLRENLNLHWLRLDEDRDECIAPRVMDSQRLLSIFVFYFSERT